ANGGRQLALPSTIESAASKSETRAWSLPRHLHIVPRRLPRAGTRSSASNKSRRSGSTSTLRVGTSGSKEQPPIRWTKTQSGWHRRNARNDSLVRPLAGDGGRRRSSSRASRRHERSRRMGLARRRVSGKRRLLEGGLLRRERRLRTDDDHAE